MLRRLPSVVARGLLYLIVGFVLTVLVWASINTMDIIVEVPATVVPGGKLRVVEPPEDAVVREILVRVGDRVKAGQPMVIVESQNVSSLLADLRQRKAELAMAVREVEEFTPMKVADLEDQLTAENEVFALRGQLHDETMHKLAGATERKAFERDMAQSRLKLLDRIVRVETQLEEKGLVAERKLLESTQTQEELQALVATLDSEWQETDTDKAIEVRRFAVDRREHERRVTELRSKIADLRRTAEHDLTEAQIWYDKAYALASLTIDGTDAGLVERAAQGGAPATDLRTLAAPVDGIVASVLVNTPGELAARGETVVELIPAGVALELEIRIDHRDIGNGQGRPGGPLQVRRLPVRAPRRAARHHRAGLACRPAGGGRGRAVVLSRLWRSRSGLFPGRGRQGSVASRHDGDGRDQDRGAARAGGHVRALARADLAGHRRALSP